MSVLTAFRAGWQTLPDPIAIAADTPSVRLLPTPSRAPESAIERRLLETLAAQGPQTPAALMSTVASALYREQHRRDGWLVDIGILGERVFVSEVAHALESGRGRLWDTAPTSCCRP